MKLKNKKEKRYRRHRRVKGKISGTADVPRLCIFRSGKHIYAQIIDDKKGKTLLVASDLELKKIKKRSAFQKRTLKGGDKPREEKARAGKVATAYEVGKLIAQKALDLAADKKGKENRKSSV